MKLLLTMNQIAYFKPETSARRLKAYYYQGEGDPVIFLGYLRLIRYLPRLSKKAQAFQPQLYRKEVRQIYLETNWETATTCWLHLFLREFREFFTPEEWYFLQRRYQRLHPFLLWLVSLQAASLGINSRFRVLYRLLSGSSWQAQRISPRQLC